VLSFDKHINVEIANYYYETRNWHKIQKKKKKKVMNINKDNVEGLYIAII
jgi:hypothetical protein